MELRLAKKEGFEDVKAIYDDIMDNSFGSDVGPSWVKGVYPSDSLLPVMLIQPSIADSLLKM